jgi:hypothetical protein
LGPVRILARGLVSKRFVHDQRFELADLMLFQGTDAHVSLPLGMVMDIFDLLGVSAVFLVRRGAEESDAKFGSSLKQKNELFQSRAAWRRKR